VGGAITGGVSDLFQFFTRPVARFDPYTTPDPRLFLCSASTPPGGGVHGMCGFNAATTVMHRSNLVPSKPDPDSSQQAFVPWLPRSPLRQRVIRLSAWMFGEEM
jgi:hypothetical protein